MMADEGKEGVELSPFWVVPNVNNPPSHLITPESTFYFHLIRMDSYSDVKLEHGLPHIPPYMDDEDDHDSHDSGDDSKRPRLRLGKRVSATSRLMA